MWRLSSMKKYFSYYMLYLYSLSLKFLLHVLLLSSDEICIQIDIDCILVLVIDFYIFSFKSSISPFIWKYTYYENRKKNSSFSITIDTRSMNAFYFCVNKVIIYIENGIKFDSLYREYTKDYLLCSQWLHIL